MSFSTEVKNELCSVSMSRACCTRAEAYGALLHASVFSHKAVSYTHLTLPTKIRV